MRISWEMSVMNIYLDLTLWSWGRTHVPWRDYGKISSRPDSVIPALSPVNQTEPVHVCKLVRSFSFIQKYCASRVLQVIVCEKISWGFKRGRCEKTLVQNMIYFHWQPRPDLCFYDTHLQTWMPGFIWAFQAWINTRFSSPQHSTILAGVGGDGNVFVCLNTEQRWGWQSDKVRQWQSCHGRKVRSGVSKYFRIYINILNTTLHSSRDILYAEKNQLNI